MVRHLCPLCGHELPCPIHIPVPTPVCACGSGKYPEVHSDGHGIYLFRACEDCFPEKIKGYRKDIMEPYDTDEQIEPDE